MFKAIKYIGISLVVISFLMLLAFFVTIGQGGETIESAAGEALPVPLLTDALIYWTYFLFGAAIVITIVVALSQFIKSFISTPGKAIKALIPVLLFVGVFVVSFFLGSGEKMNIIGYEGTQNVGIWAQISDMIIYTTYTLLAAVLLTIVGARIYTALK